MCKPGVPSQIDFTSSQTPNFTRRQRKMLCMQSFADLSFFRELKRSIEAGLGLGLSRRRVFTRCSLVLTP